MGVNTAQVGNHWREGIVQRAPSVNNQVFVGLFQFSSFCLQWVAILADDDKFSTIPDENQSDERRKSISDRVIDFVAVWHPFPEKWRIASHLTGYSVFVMARPEPEYGLFSRSNRANAIIGLSIDRLSKNLFDGRQNSRYTRRSSDLFWPPNVFKMAGRQSLSEHTTSELRLGPRKWHILAQKIIVVYEVVANATFCFSLPCLWLWSRSLRVESNQGWKPWVVTIRRLKAGDMVV